MIQLMKHEKKNLTLTQTTLSTAFSLHTCTVLTLVWEWDIHDENPYNPLFFIRILKSQKLGNPYKEGLFVCSLYIAIEVFEIIQILARGNGQKQIFSKIQQTQKKAILNNLSLTKAKKGFGRTFAP
jgi:hypothetical protein